MGIQKIRPKHSAFHKHGKHRSVLMEVRRLQQAQRQQPTKMFPSVQEAMQEAVKAAERKR